MSRIVVEIEDARWGRDIPNARAIARRAATSAAEATVGTIAILLTDDAVVRDLNARFRGKDAPTNVLAFPAARGAGSLGDIALAHGVCAQEAADQHKSLADHLSHLVVHGVLHLRGHDHLSDDEANAMEALERRLLARLGVADPYALPELVKARG